MPTSQGKAPDAFRTIGEVAEELGVAQHVLRFWENKFSPIRPMKRSGGRRYYRRQDIELLQGIQHLLYEEGLTIKGVQKLLKERGPRYVIEVGRKKSMMDGSEPAADGEAEVPCAPDAVPQLDLPLLRERAAMPAAVTAPMVVAAAGDAEPPHPQTRPAILLALRRELVAAREEIQALLRPRDEKAD